MLAKFRQIYGDSGLGEAEDDRRLRDAFGFVNFEKDAKELQINRCHYAARQCLEHQWTLDRELQHPSSRCRIGKALWCLPDPEGTPRRTAYR